MILKPGAAIIALAWCAILWLSRNVSAQEIIEQIFITHHSSFIIHNSKHLLIVLAGIVLGQVVLYGPSLAGRKILLPLDILAEEGVYLPRTPEVSKIVPQNTCLLDQVCFCEPARRFEVSELHAGRLPMWAPYHFAGVPFIWPKFSPLLALRSLIASPVILAWSQLLAAIVAGVGAYVFCRRALGVSFWPGAVAGWCYPLTGFLVFWQGWPTSMAVYWLPWILLVVDRTVRGGGETNDDGGAPASCRLSAPEPPKQATCRRSGRLLSRRAPVGLAVVTCLVLLSGHLDVAGQVLLVSGLYALWCLYDTRSLGWFRPAVLKLAAGWALGFLLAAPYILPALEYTRTGERMARRSAGQEERPPGGWTALLETVVPDLYGTDRSDTLRIGNLVQVESAAGAYTGVLAALVLAPLAWCSRRQRSRNVFWALLFAGGLSWCVGLPGVVQFLRLPGLNMFSHNRLVFASSFAILALMAVGLEALSKGEVEWRGWFWFPAALLGCLCAWCASRALDLPEPIATLLANDVLRGIPAEWVHDMEGVRQVQAWYARHYVAAAAWCGLGVAAWLVLWWRARPHPSKVAQVSKPAVSPISKSSADGGRGGNPLYSRFGNLRYEARHCNHQVAAPRGRGAGLWRPALVRTWPKRPVRSGALFPARAGAGRDCAVHSRARDRAHLSAGLRGRHARPARHPGLRLG